MRMIISCKKQNLTILKNAVEQRCENSSNVVRKYRETTAVWTKLAMELLQTILTHWAVQAAHDGLL